MEKAQIFSNSSSNPGSRTGKKVPLLDPVEEHFACYTREVVRVRFFVTTRIMLVMVSKSALVPVQKSFLKAGGAPANHTIIH